MYNIRLGYGCGIKATLLTSTGAVFDLRKARYKGAVLMLPNGASIPCADVSIDDVTNSVYVRLLADRELTMIGKYGIMFNLKLANGVMYSSPMVVFAEVSADAEVEYKELNISLGVALTYLPANVAYTGASPKIGPNGTWLVYNDELNAYEDTGEPANYGGLLGEVQSLKDIIETSLTPQTLTNAVKVDWETIGKNAGGELCYIGAGIGDNEGNIDLAILEGYLTDKGYAKHIDIVKEYATKEWVENKKYITIDSLPKKISAFANDKGYITIDALAPYATLATTLGGYGITNAYTKTETDARIFGEVKRLFEDPRFVTAAVNIDDRTIKRDGNGALYVDETALSISGGGGGGIADSVHWNNVTGKPSWIGSTKPSYKYSEIEEKPDLSVYAKTTDIPSLAGYATQSWVEGRGYLLATTASNTYQPKITSSNKLAYSLISGTPDLSVYFLASNFTKANIKSTLGISDWALASAKPTYTASEVGALGVNGTAQSALKMTPEYLTDLNNATPWRFFDMNTGYGSTDGNKPNIAWVSGITGTAAGSSNYRWQLAMTTGDNRPYFRQEGKGDWNNWSTLAFTSDIPTKLSQLTDDVVAGNYLSTKGGTINGSITAYLLKSTTGYTLTSVENESCGLMRNSAITTEGNSADIWLYNTKDIKYRAANHYFTSGNVAIGGTAAEAKLHVHGNGIFTDNLSVPSITVGGVTLRKVDNYLYLDSSLVLSGGVTMYGDDGTTVKPIWESIPLDSSTLAWVNGKLSVVGGVGSGGISEEFLNTKLQGYQPLLSTSNKLPYSLISGTPDLSVFALKSEIPSLNGYATQTWVENKGYLLATTASNTYQSKITSSNKLAYSLISGTPDLSEYFLKSSFTKANIKSTLGISDWALASAKPTYTASEVGALGVNNTAQSALKMTPEYLTDLNSATPWRFFDMNTGYGSTDGNKPNIAWVSGITGTAAGSSNYRWQLAMTTGSQNPYFRREHNGNWNNWSTLAFTSNIPTKLSQLTDDLVAGNYLSTKGGTINGSLTATSFIGTLTGNADSSTKLATARTIWGQSFDGTKDVTGAITVDGDATFSSKVIIGTIPIYRLADGTLFVDANVVFSGSVTMYGNTTTTITEE